MSDLTVLMQLIADGNLLDEAPPSYARLKQSLGRLQEDAHVITLQEQRRYELFREKMLFEREHELQEFDQQEE